MKQTIEAINFISNCQRVVSRLLDCIYPASCALCEASLTHGRALCDECAGRLPRLSPPFCMRCGEPFHGKIESAFACPNCEHLELDFHFARPALVRDDQALALVHRLKYQREIHLARELGGLAAESLADERFADALAERWPLVPVPLHRHRLRDRHFNQAEELARMIADISGLPIIHALRRVRSTGTQTALNRHQRLKNLKNAFALTRTGVRTAAVAVPGVILVDDVLTTGSTLSACASVLRDAGFRTVAAITLMRG